MNIYSNAITRYDDMIYASRPVKINEFISDKYNNVHIELFNDAIKKFFNDIINNTINSKFIYNFFRTLENTYQNDNDIDIDRFNDNLKTPNGEFINKSLKNLSIDTTEYYKRIIDITNEYIKRIKNAIIDNQILMDKDIFSIISDLGSITDFRILYINNAQFLEAENDLESYEKIFPLYEIYKDSSESDGEIVEKNFFLSELENYVFILEAASNTRIGYSIDGHFLLILDSSTYNSNPINNFNFSKYITTESKGILEAFRNEALSMFKKQHRIIEIKNKEYWMPSSIVLISNVFPFKRMIVSLRKYWNNIQSLNDLNIADIKITNEAIRDAEILELNYIKGIAKMRSKSTDIIFNVPFGYLNESVDVSDEYNIDLISSH